MLGIIINGCTSIDNGCIINTGVTIDYDNIYDTIYYSIIGDYIHILSGTSLVGIIYIGKDAGIGLGSAVSNNIRILGNCKVGLGALVVKDIII